MEILKIWRGGMSFYGGFLGIIFVTHRFCRKNKIDFLRFLDLWALGVPIGLFLGRIANFINTELLGKVSDVPWKVIFKDGIPRHPSQIYEALLEGGLLFGVMLTAFHRKCYLLRGLSSGIFCAGYGAARFCGEFFREPDSEFSGRLLDLSGLNLNQYISLLMLLLGVFLILRGKNP
jgi:phosphatidylglycerol:prolipoprotein diacylglycerol transferase